MNLACSPASALPSILLCLYTPTYLSAFSLSIYSPFLILNFFLFTHLSLVAPLLSLLYLTSHHLFFLVPATIHFSLLSPPPICLLSEGTVRVPAGHQAVVRAAQTVTWSAWSRGPGAAQTRTAPTAPSGRPWPRRAASLASPSSLEGIASEATKVHREAARALALVRTVDRSTGTIAWFCGPPSKL